MFKIPPKIPPKIGQLGLSVVRDDHTAKQRDWPLYPLDANSIMSTWRPWRYNC